MERPWPEEALDFGDAVAGVLERLGGVGLARRCEVEPGLRDSLVGPALAELGLADLDPYVGELEAAAAARAARAAGAVACPWPIAQRLAVPTELRGSVDAVYLTDGPVSRLEHIDIHERSCIAVDIVTSDLYTIDVIGRPASMPLDPFGSSCQLGDATAGEGTAALSALVVLTAFWASGALGSARDLAVVHARERRQFGHRIGEFGGIQVHLSEIAVAHDSLWELACFTLARFVDGRATRADLLALQYAMVDSARSVFAHAHQVLAAIGLCDEHDLTVLDRHAQHVVRRPASSPRLLGLLADEIARSGFDNLLPDRAGHAARRGPRPVSVRLTEAEALEFVESEHTGILSTLRADGSPASVPLWFVVIDGTVCLRTLRSSAKAKHVRRDPRVSFLVERGQAWAELKAVIIYANAEEIADPAVTTRVDEAFTTKYESFTMPSSTPDRTREHYAADRVRLRLTPTRPPLTWDNAKLLR